MEKRQTLLAERDALLRLPLNGHPRLSPKERAAIAERVRDGKLRQTFATVKAGSTWQRGKN